MKHDELAAALRDSRDTQREAAKVRREQKKRDADEYGESGRKPKKRKRNNCTRKQYQHKQAHKKGHDSEGEESGAEQLIAVSRKSTRKAKPTWKVLASDVEMSDDEDDLEVEDGEQDSDLEWS
jgi:hypothetical protein